MSRFSQHIWSSKRERDTPKTVSQDIFSTKPNKKWLANRKDTLIPFFPVNKESFENSGMDKNL